MELDPRTSYARRVVVALGIVVLVGGVVGAATYASVESDVKDRQRAALGGQADAQADVVRTILENRMDDTAQFGGTLRTSSVENRLIISTLGRQARSSEQIQRVLYAHQNGTVRESSDGLYEGRTLSATGFTAPPDSLERGDVVVHVRDGSGMDGSPSWVFASRAGIDHWVLVQVDLAAVAEEVDAILEGTRTRVVDADGTVVLDTDNLSAVGTQHVGGAGVDSPAVRAGLNGTGNTTVVPGSSPGTGERIVGHQRIEGTDWVLVTSTAPSTLFAIAHQVGRSVLAMVGTFAVLLAAFGLLVERPTVRALDELASNARSLRDGDLDTAFESDRRDEVGEVFRTFDEMRLNLGETIEEAERARDDAEAARRDAERLSRHLERTAAEYGEVMAACAEGDLTRRMDPDDESDAMRAIAESFNGMMDRLEAVVHGLEGFAEEVAAASEEVTASSEEVQSSADEAARSVQEIADGAGRQDETLQSVADEMDALSTTVEEMAASANQVAETAEETADTGADARETAETAIEGMESVEREATAAVDAIQALQERMGEIEEITAFITEIAEQTNILALNASIEAARAGEAGEGFAVVAEEVKDLAEETRDAAEDIETLVADVRDQTETTAREVQATSEEVARSTDAVEETVDALREIAEYAEETNVGVQEISAATQQQAASTNEVVSMVDETAAIAEQTADEASTVAGASEEQTAALSGMTDSAKDLSAEADALCDSLGQFETAPDDRNRNPDRAVLADGNGTRGED